MTVPILKAEPFLYPEGLLEPVDHPPPDTGDAKEQRWWGLYAKARQEKALSRWMTAF